MTRHIALDGPLNGDYIDARQAFAHEYELTEWTEGEQAYLHVPSDALATDENGVPLEIVKQLEEIEQS